MAHLTRGQKAKRATRAMPEEDPEFQIAPMIDILLVLLVFFMSIATDQVLQVNKEVVLPIAIIDKAENEKKETKSEVFVNVLWSLDNSGRIEVDGKGAMEHQALTAYIKGKKENAAAAGIPEFRVIIRADKRAKYQYVRTVMAAIGDAAVPNVIFSAVDKEINQPK